MLQTFSIVQIIQTLQTLIIIIFQAQQIRDLLSSNFDNIMNKNQGFDPGILAMMLKGGEDRDLG